ERNLNDSQLRNVTKLSFGYDSRRLICRQRIIILI
ncbi:unnamed protein product, partial [Rotaria sp. Silwood2]